MVSRRATLALLAGTLGGCIGGPDPASETPETVTSPPPSSGTETQPEPAPDPDTPPDDWPPEEWTSDWTHDVPVSHVVGLDVVDGRLIITANDNPGNTVVQSYDPASRSVEWSRELTGEATAHSTLQRSTRLRNWGVTDAGGTLLSVTGGKPEHDWTELHAIDTDSGEERWSLGRERSLAVRGLVDETAYVFAREFEEQPTEHHHGTDTPTPEPVGANLLAVDLTDGSVHWSRDFTGIGALSADDRGVYVAVMNRLFGLDHDGSRQWRIRGDSRGKAIFPGSDVVYYVAKPEWNRMVVRGVSHDGDVRWTRRFEADEAVRYDDRLYVAGNSLVAVQPDGTLAWTADGSAGRLTFSPSGERVYVRSGDRADAIRALALDDGSPRWLFDPPINNAWPEAVTDETLIAGGIGEIGQPLYRVDAATGDTTARYLYEHAITTRAFGDYLYAGIGRYEEGGQVLALPL
jgi:hypothetical protein